MANDLRSLEEFVNDSNKYDNRLEMLEKWIVRKEREIRERTKLPSGKFHKSDKDIAEAREHKNAVRRRKVLETVARRKYNEISKDALGILVEKISKRMYLFDGEYPQFMIDLVKELREHPNITTTDKMVLTF